MGGGGRLVMPAMKLLIVAATNPSILLPLKSLLVAGSVTSTIEQAAHCGEHQPLWEQRVREREPAKTGREKIGDVGEDLQTWTTDQELLLA